MTGIVGAGTMDGISTDQISITFVKQVAYNFQRFWSPHSCTIKQLYYCAYCIDVMSRTTL